MFEGWRDREPQGARVVYSLGAFSLERRIPISLSHILRSNIRLILGFFSSDNSSAVPMDLVEVKQQQSCILSGNNLH